MIVYQVQAIKKIKKYMNYSHMIYIKNDHPLLSLESFECSKKYFFWSIFEFLLPNISIGVTRSWNNSPISIPLSCAFVFSLDKLFIIFNQQYKKLNVINFYIKKNQIITDGIKKYNHYIINQVSLVLFQQKLRIFKELLDHQLNSKELHYNSSIINTIYQHIVNTNKLLLANIAEKKNIVMNFNLTSHKKIKNFGILVLQYDAQKLKKIFRNVSLVIQKLKTERSILNHLKSHSLMKFDINSKFYQVTNPNNSTRQFQSESAYISSDVRWDYNSKKQLNPIKAKNLEIIYKMQEFNQQIECTVNNIKELCAILNVLLKSIQKNRDIILQNRLIQNTISEEMLKSVVDFFNNTEAIIQIIHELNKQTEFIVIHLGIHVQNIKLVQINLDKLLNDILSKLSFKHDVIN